MDLQEYKISSVSRVCTIIGLILDGLSFLTLTIFTIYFKTFFNFFIRLIELDSDVSFNDINMIKELYGLINGIFIIVCLIIGIFFIINLILFTKLINSKVSKQHANSIVIYQIIYAVLSLAGSTISAILYLISGINAYSDLKPAITDPVIDDY